MAGSAAVWTLVVIALVVALLVGALVLVRWRPRPVTVAAPIEGVEPLPGPTERGPPLPVILVHGLFGFDRIGVPGARFDYFRGIAKHLDSLGCHAHAVKLPMAASVPARAKRARRGDRGAAATRASI